MEPMTVLAHSFGATIAFPARRTAPVCVDFANLILLAAGWINRDTTQVQPRQPDPNP